MSGMDRFEAWWQTLNVYDPALKALAGSAWMEATRSLSTTSDKDPWVTQDRVPARVGVDEYRYASFEEDDWRPVTGDWDDFAVHGWVDHEGDTLLLRCRLSQLPEVCDVPEQPAGDPDEWVIQDRVPARVMIDRCWYMNGNCKLPENPEEMWQKFAHDHFLDGKGHGDFVNDGAGTLHVMCRRRDLPKVEQALLGQRVEQTLTPEWIRQAAENENGCPVGAGTSKIEQQKTRVRLWMQFGSGHFGSAVVASTFEKTGDWQEIHYDAEGFYVEKQH